MLHEVFRMKSIATLTALIVLAALPGVASAHAADMPLLQHAIEHGWLVLAVVPLLALLMPLGRERR
jgi:hypothetical protein